MLKKLLHICILLLSVFLCASYRWYALNFDVSFEAILFTMRSPLVGADLSFLIWAVKGIIKSIIWICILLVFGIILIDVIANKYFKP